ncbi:MAG: CoA ester lyase [Nitrosopumilus sp.]|nr:CoA ester lyase [Nitrosopumilus sp.]CAI9831429.1 Citryl-CoA lyase [Nitrosopumilaceae archaeon]MDA7940838.1 CoA ester lyase [Nitrosopumilus sp.]MDA7943306.1 CoA ester lyase [Nitrosopumilus sp.]MDA7944201.1 CoA ester lyase [Nitrosopumilus sp.]
MEFRSLLFVPGNNPRFVAKSRTARADAVCLDLEDSVPAAEKQEARRAVREALGGRFEGAALVRTNSPGSGMMEDDLRAACGPGLDGVVIPKVDAAREVDAARRLMDSLGCGAPVLPSIESALGVVNAFGIASCGGTSALVFGVFDLLHDMGSEYEGGGSAAYARSKVPVDARAAGRYAIDSVWQDVRDPGGLADDCRRGRSMGYLGKCAIHPDQLPAIHGGFAPSEGQLALAREVRDAYEASAASGRGATTVRGRMIDEVHYKQAVRLLGPQG